MSDKPPAVGICDAKKLINLVQAGDLDALDHITRCYGQRLLAVGRRQCRDDDRAQDAVQDALLSAGEHLRDFRGDGSLEGWLIRMVTNACRRMQRGRKNDPGLHAELDDEAPPSGQVSPEEIAGRGQLAAALGAALLRLPARDRALLLLADAEDWRATELAEAFRVTPASLRTRMSRARKRLREELGPLWSEWSEKEREKEEKALS
jgi:RNA polymerase sigma-70 factor (ECF subfamily)